MLWWSLLKGHRQFLDAEGVKKSRNHRWSQLKEQLVVGYSLIEINDPFGHGKVDLSFNWIQIRQIIRRQPPIDNWQLVHCVVGNRLIGHGWCYLLPFSGRCIPHLFRIKETNFRAFVTRSYLLQIVYHVLCPEFDFILRSEDNWNTIGLMLDLNLTGIKYSERVMKGWWNSWRRFQRMRTNIITNRSSRQDWHWLAVTVIIISQQRYHYQDDLEHLLKKYRSGLMVVKLTYNWKGKYTRRSWRRRI